MKKEVSPTVVGIILGVVLVAVLIIGYRTLAPSQKAVTTGSEEYMEKVKRGEPMYTPPPGVVPGSPGAGGSAARVGTGPGGAAPGGGYNLTPPPN
jgi:hypothetical protein